MRRLVNASVVDLTARTLLQLLKALECYLKLVRRVELSGVVLDLDTEKRDNRHIGSGGWECMPRAEVGMLLMMSNAPRIDGL